jgi:P-type conjugative transfer protein TrbG
MKPFISLGLLAFLITSSTALANGEVTAGSHKLAIINAKQQYILASANPGKTNPNKFVSKKPVPKKTFPASDGSVTFSYGATLPTIICAPLHICDIRLKQGEVLIKANIGDSVRWAYDTAVSGTSNEAVTTHVIIKPMDSGLSTNMILNTDQRTYHLKLVSERTNWMAKVAFTYPEDPNAIGNDKTVSSLPQKETLSPLKVDVLDFGYQISGDSPIWKPVRVYSDGVKTYVQFPRNVHHEDVPVLVSLGVDDKEQLVNYRMQGDFFIVDKLLKEALLISGHGRHQEKVKIKRIGGAS